MTSPTSPNGAMLYTQGFGSRPENVEIPIIQNRAPTAQDTQKGFLPIGKRWIDETNNAEYVLTSYSTSGGPLTATWVFLGSSAGSLTAVAGTTNQITSTTSAGTATLTLPATVIAPGSIVATTTLTATLGNITATNGNLVLNAAGNKLQIHATTAASDSIGTSAALDGASPSQLVVATTAVTASSKIFLTYATPGGTPGFLSIGTIVPGTSFQIKSSANGDTSTVNYLIIN